MMWIFVAYILTIIIVSVVCIVLDAPRLMVIYISIFATGLWVFAGLAELYDLINSLKEKTEPTKDKT